MVSTISFVVLVIFLGQFLHLISVNNVLFWIIYIIFPYVQILKDLLKVQNWFTNKLDLKVNCNYKYFIRWFLQNVRFTEKISTMLKDIKFFRKLIFFFRTFSSRLSPLFGKRKKRIWIINRILIVYSQSRWYVYSFFFYQICLLFICQTQNKFVGYAN